VNASGGRALDGLGVPTGLPNLTKLRIPRSAIREPISTWVAKLQGRTEVHESSLNSFANYSCQRRQLRSGRLTRPNLRPAGAAFPSQAGNRLDQANITSSSGRCHDRSSDMNSGAERPGAIRNRVRTESGPRDVSNHGPTQLPRGLWLLLRRPERSHVSRRDDPAKRPESVKTIGVRKGNGTAGSERARQSP